jgi:hypothetical protein
MSQSNVFLKNVDRTLLTFNMHNMAEMCFNHVFKRKNMGAVDPTKLNSEQ